jgi:beta-N-acetylhexosaminidase
MAEHAMSVGELFIFGFFGKSLPTWLKEFAARYGLGGVILFAIRDSSP